jgi:hypothetical protein
MTQNAISAGYLRFYDIYLTCNQAGKMWIFLAIWL